MKNFSVRKVVILSVALSIVSILMFIQNVFALFVYRKLNNDSESTILTVTKPDDYMKMFINSDGKEIVRTCGKYIPDMGGLIDEIARYDNTKNAIGYSVYYYANMMYSRDDLKMIAVDGVEPSNQTIADNTYPLITESYVAVRKDDKKDYMII